MKIKSSVGIIGFLVMMNTIITYLIITTSVTGTTYSAWVISVLLILPLVFIFNFLVRRHLEFKPYFTSKLNILTSKYSATITSELSRDLMYQKMVEVIQNSPIKLVYANDEALEILGTKGITWSSWGENIYINFSESKGKTHMHFISTTVVGMVSWGKNEKNYNRLLSTYEESLTI